MKEPYAASIRAMAGEPSVFFRGEQLTTTSQTFNKPALHASNATRRLEYRALADAFSLRLKHHNSELHAQHAPEFAVAGLVFDVLEQLRLESLAVEQEYVKAPGVKSNLHNRFKLWAGKVQSTELLENHAGMLLFSLAVAVWTRLNKQEVPLEVDGLIESSRAAIGAQAGPQLQQLYRQKHEQAEFAQTSLKIAAVIESMLQGGAQSENGKDSSEERERHEPDDALQSALRISGLLPTDPALNQALVLPTAAADDSQRAIAVGVDTYRVFTRDYDSEGQAIDLLRRDRLELLRAELDEAVNASGINATRFSNELKQLLSSSNFGRWEDAQEFGFFNPAELSSLKSNPNKHTVFRRERAFNNNDCHVTILLDCSGSMKRHADTAALLCDLLNRAFGQAEISCEILGFTTNSWNGGTAFKQWCAHGKPANPGRLSEQRHTVYKAAEQSWRKARLGIAGLLRTDLYREGIDGEALQWAYKRIEAVPQSRKVILMVSDGSPMETGTAKANDGFYLGRHLQGVARSIEASGKVALCALGVGLDLSPYYRSSLGFDTQCKLGLIHLRSIARLIQAALVNTGSRTRSSTKTEFDLC